jgi:hypothetical protein
MEFGVVVNINTETVVAMSFLSDAQETVIIGKHTLYGLE